MMQVVQQYIFDKKLDPLPDAVLRAEVASYDQKFTYAGIPTERIPEVYLEAMTHHGPYLLKVDDYLRAWDRIKPKEGDGVDVSIVSGRSVKGPDGKCNRCQDTGTEKKWIPHNLANPYMGEEVEFPCPFGCKAVVVKA